MAYDRQELVREVDAILSSKPHTTLASICGTVGVERHTLRKAIHQLKGMTFREYQQMLVAAEAIRLLRSSPGLSIKQVAVSLGYRSPRAFARFLKRATGKRPTELRR